MLETSLLCSYESLAIGDVREEANEKIKIERDTL